MQAASTKTYVCCVASEPPLNETAEFQCAPGSLPVSHLRSLSLLKQLDKGYVLQGPGSDRQPKYHEEGELINGRHPENWLGIGPGRQAVSRRDSAGNSQHGCRDSCSYRSHSSQIRSGLCPDSLRQLPSTLVECHRRAMTIAT